MTFLQILQVHRLTQRTLVLVFQSVSNSLKLQKYNNDNSKITFPG